jgi:hypothetical protein
MESPEAVDSIHIATEAPPSREILPPTHNTAENMEKIELIF